MADALFKNIQPLFENFKNETNVEFEMRLGRINSGSFDTDIGVESFDKIMNGLEKYKEWETVKKTNTSVYYKADIRTSVDEDTDESITILKKKLSKTNFNIPGKPYDMRFAVSKEIPCVSGEDHEMDSVRIKNRISFIRKNLSIDMTVVTGDANDLDCEDEARYEVELEIIDPTQISDRDTLYNIIYKVFDVLTIIS